MMRAPMRCKRARGRSSYPSRELADRSTIAGVRIDAGALLRQFTANDEPEEEDDDA
jgi:hypothetical protein